MAGAKEADQTLSARHNPDASPRQFLSPREKIVANLICITLLLSAFVHDEVAGWIKAKVLGDVTDVLHNYGSVDDVIGLKSDLRNTPDQFEICGRLDVFER